MFSFGEKKPQHKAVPLPKTKALTKVHVHLSETDIQKWYSIFCACCEDDGFIRNSKAISIEGCVLFKWAVQFELHTSMSSIGMIDFDSFLRIANFFSPLASINDKIEYMFLIITNGELFLTKREYIDFLRRVSRHTLSEEVWSNLGDEVFKTIFRSDSDELALDQRSFVTIISMADVSHYMTIN